MGDWEETQPGQVTQTDQRDIPDHAQCIQCGAEGGREGCLELGYFLPKQPLHLMGPCSPGGGRAPAMGSSKLTPCFSLLVYAASAFPIKLSLSQPLSFPAFTLLIPSPVHWW